jgi:hypothetical protein
MSDDQTLAVPPLNRGAIFLQGVTQRERGTSSGGVIRFVEFLTLDCVAFAVQEVASVQHVGPMGVEGAEAYAKRSARFPFGTACRAPLCRAAKLRYGRGEGKSIAF